MTRPDVDAIRARVEATTEGPWEFECERVTADGSAYISPRVYIEGWLGYPVDDATEILLPASDSDAEFIAHARQDAPALLAYVEQLEAQIEQVRGLHKKTYSNRTVRGWTCSTCCDPWEDKPVKWPCPTIRALDAPKGICDHGCESLTGLCIVDHKRLGGDGE